MLSARSGRPVDAERPDFSELISRGVAVGGGALPIDGGKVIDTAKALAAAGTTWIAEKDGRIVAYLGGQAFEHPWLNRAQLNVVAWYSIYPGAGILLARRCIRWARNQPNITTISWWVNDEFAEETFRALKLLTKQKPARASGFVITV